MSTMREQFKSWWSNPTKTAEFDLPAGTIDVPAKHEIRNDGTPNWRHTWELVDGRVVVMTTSGNFYVEEATKTSTGCRWCDSHGWERCQCSDPDTRPELAEGRYLSPDDPQWWDLKKDLHDES